MACGRRHRIAAKALVARGVGSIVDIETRRGFLNMAAWFQGGTLLLALVLWEVSGVSLEHRVILRWQDVCWGLAGVVPMLGLFFYATEIRHRVEELLGKSLSQCTWWDLAALALLAGLGEELLFRGVLQPWIGRWNPWGGIIIVNLLFGLAHAITPSYFLFATGIGLYFSWLYAGFPDIHHGVGSPNLVRPIVAHAVYDFLAFLLLVREYRQRGNYSQPESGQKPIKEETTEVDTPDEPG